MFKDTMELQRMTCEKFEAEYLATRAGDKLGVAENVMSGLQPINGLRHLPRVGTSGWYIWAGETLSDDLDFFKPLYASHIKEWCPKAEPFLGLAPGWRFLIAADFSDVWFDPTLLKVR